MSFFNPALLIEEVKKKPALYRTEPPADREEKLLLWKEVGAVIYHDWDTYNKATAYDRVLQLQRKWRSLRDAYNRELRARKSGIRINRRVYKYFKKMSFLGGFTGPVSDNEDSADETNVIIEMQVQNDTEDMHEPRKVVPGTVKIKKQRKRRQAKREPSSDGIPEPEEQEMPIFPMEITSDNDADSDKLFLLSFLPEMRQLPVNIKMWVRSQIANVMQEAVDCHYNNTQPGSSGDKNGIDTKRQNCDMLE